MNEREKLQDQKNYFRVRAEVSLPAVQHNLAEVRRKINPATKLLAVVKADAYGHGAVPVVEAIEEKNLADYYGVAIIEEAVKLREAGVKKPILILGYTDQEQYELLVSYDITQTIFQYEMAEALSREALRQGRRARIHIKLDTGMTRIGFTDSAESIEEIKRIASLDNIDVEGIFSHFACADETDKTSAKKQLSRYRNFVDLLEKEELFIPIRHIANSAGIIELPETYFNMVRCGIATYGIYPSDEVNQAEVKLIPAMEIKSHIIFVKEVEPGVGVSYGSTYITGKKTKIATIPVGYADGYSRNLSNCGKVIIHGQLAPIIGRICMDQFMVDVTGIGDVRQGDTVTLLGRDGDALISAEELSAWSHSFAYELVCTVGTRIPREYLS